MTKPILFIRGTWSNQPVAVRADRVVSVEPFNQGEPGKVKVFYSCDYALAACITSHEELARCGLADAVAAR